MTDKAPPIKIPFIDLKTQYATLRGELIEASTRVLDSGRYILGAEGRAFEEEFAAASGLPLAAGVSSGTQALQLALEACGVRPGDEVALPAFTFIATATAVSVLGARPIFIDVEPDSLNIDPRDLKRRLTPQTRAVIPVHLYGRPADLDAVLAVTRGRGIRVVEDCAQAHLARFKGRPVGGDGALGAFSFYPTKNLGALGDAGALTTRETALHEQIKILRNCGRRPGRQYDHSRIGHNNRLDELQAAFLRVKLRRLAQWTDARRALAARYRRGLGGLPLRLPPEDKDGTRSVYHQFVIQTVRRDELARALAAAGIGTAVYYPLPLHLQAAYRSHGTGPGDYPESERASREVLALPIFPELKPADVDEVCARVKAFFR